MPSRAAPAVACFTARSRSGSSVTGVEPPRPRTGTRQAARIKRQTCFMTPSQAPGPLRPRLRFRRRFRNIGAPTLGDMRVLIAEDEPYLAEALQTGLRREAIAADIALDGDAALDRLPVTPYHVLFPH